MTALLGCLYFIVYVHYRKRGLIISRGTIIGDLLNGNQWAQLVSGRSGLVLNIWAAVSEVHINFISRN